jgi:hypothetical protein
LSSGGYQLSSRPWSAHEQVPMRTLVDTSRG